jgi:SAM domain (Sterile alpha motif)
MNIAVWLRSLGLGRYEAAFRENDIDETVLPRLTHETLKDLGITSVGHRLKLLDAIAALIAWSPTRQSPAPVLSSTSQPEDGLGVRVRAIRYPHLSGKGTRRYLWPPQHNTTYHLVQCLLRRGRGCTVRRAGGPGSSTGDGPLGIGSGP